MNGNPRINFNTLLKTYNVTVWDTCAILQYLDKTKDPVKDPSFMGKLAEKIKEGHICVIPQAIIKELETHKPIYFTGRKNKEKLIETYNNFYQKNQLYLDEQKVEKEIAKESIKYAWHKISYPDLAVFEHAKIFSEKRIPTAIISNDMGLSKVWNEYVKETRTPNSILGFLPRLEGLLFELFQNRMKRGKNHILINDRVTILDDIEKWRKVTTNNLSHYGCNKITYFKNKNNIIETYQSNNIQTPNIAFLDINLNPKDPQNKEGLKVCQFFKETIPNTTIVAMSSLENIAQEAKKSGANFIIQKKNFVQDFDTFVQQYTERL